MSKPKEIIIFHFAPMELYPPLINLGTYLSQQINEGTHITIITTKTPKSLNTIDLPNIRIIRHQGIDPKKSILNKILRYFNIYSSTLWVLIKLRPKVVLYFETLSSLPVLIYKKLFRKTHVFIHYHELVTLKELKHGRALNNFLNKVEMNFYSKTAWISQTNTQRLIYFKEQYNLDLESKVLKVLPNYPPQSWIETKADSRLLQDKVLRMLHIGALSDESLYLKEVLKFFGNKKNVQIDFFSHSVNSKILEEFKRYNNIKFMGSIDYSKIPTLKGLYQVGLVLYKGISLNVKYCAPNKIFEYLALDMDVWCSDKLITAQVYKNDKTYPKMLIVNFDNLEGFDLKANLTRKGLSYKKSPYFYENIYGIILNAINRYSNN